MNRCPPAQRSLRSLVLALAMLVLPSLAAAQVVCCNTSTLTCSVTGTTSMCVISGGVFYAAGSSCPATNPCQIRCCLADGSCSLLIFNTSTVCPGGNFGAGAGGCTPQPGPCPPVGACCTTAGSCSQLYQSQCTTSGYTWTSGAACSPSSCAGACCLNMGACGIQTAAICAGGLGVYQGPAVSCLTNPCPQVACCGTMSGACALSVNGTCPPGLMLAPTITSTCIPTPCLGACCNRWTGHCVVESIAACQAHGLRFDGVGLACSPTTCKACPADFDGSGALAIADIFAMLNAWFAGCP